MPCILLFITLRRSLYFHWIKFQYIPLHWHMHFCIATAGKCNWINLHYSKMHCSASNCTNLHCSTLHYSIQQYIAMYQIAFQFMSVHRDKCIVAQFSALHLKLNSCTLQNRILHYISVHCSASNCIAVHRDKVEGSRSQARFTTRGSTGLLGQKNRILWTPGPNDDNESNYWKWTNLVI